MIENFAAATNYAVPPGATLAEWLKGASLAQGALAARLGRSTKMVNQLINGVAPRLAPSNRLQA